MFVLPLLVGDPESYTSSDWRRAVLWVASAAIVGFSVESLMYEKRSRTRQAREHERTIAAIAGVTRALTAEADARDHICRATLEIAGAAHVAIWEPDEPGESRAHGSCRNGCWPTHGSDTSTESSGTGRAFTSGDRYFVADAVGNANLPQDAVRRMGVVSMLFEPIARREHRSACSASAGRAASDDVDEQTTAGCCAPRNRGCGRDRASGLPREAERPGGDGRADGASQSPILGRDHPGAVGYARRTRRPLCVAIVDLDHFKQFNDVHGHQAGDRLLKSSASAWRTALRQTDTLARYGGEEFGVVLPGCSADVAEVVLERLRELTPDGQTCSVGLAEWSPGESDADVVARADAALYAAKRAGRDALVVHA